MTIDLLKMQPEYYSETFSGRISRSPWTWMLLAAHGCDVSSNKPTTIQLLISLKSRTFLSHWLVEELRYGKRAICCIIQNYPGRRNSYNPTCASPNIHCSIIIVFQFTWRALVKVAPSYCGKMIATRHTIWGDDVHDHFSEIADKKMEKLEISQWPSGKTLKKTIEKGNL